jgi:hypothetical protein
MKAWLVPLSCIGLLSLGAQAQDTAPAAPAPGPHAACKADVQKLCSGVQPGGGRIMACLKEHKDEVSQACRDSFGKMKPAHPDQGDSGKPQ